MFIGKNLTNIRIMNGLSRSELADKIGVTEQAVWQYENGYVSPKLEIVNRLKILFHVKSLYFYRSNLLEESDLNNIHAQHIAYRSETINSMSKTQSELMHIRYLETFLQTIENKINYPVNLLLNIRNEVIAFLQKNAQLDRKLQIKHVAQFARDRIGLDNNSNQNLMFLLEKTGAFIFEKEIGDTIDAYSLWTENDRPYIILGTIKKSAARRNFDLAHELGHLLLHYKVEFTMLDRNAYRLFEDEAHSFASEFLLPEEAFRADVQHIAKKSNPDSYIDLKLKWTVSLQAIAMRARKLDIISYQQLRYFYMSINKKGYKTLEPLDEEIPINRPMKIKSILQLLFEEGIYTVSSLIDQLNIDKQFFTELTGIEQAFFEQFLQKEKQVFTVNELGIKRT